MVSMLSFFFWLHTIDENLSIIFSLRQSWLEFSRVATQTKLPQPAAAITALLTASHQNL